MSSLSTADLRPSTAERRELTLKVLILALLLGLLGDLLLRNLPWGVNMTLWMTALIATLLWLGRSRREIVAGGGGWLLLLLGLFSAAFAWRDSPVLKLLDVAAILVALSLLLWRAEGGDVARAGTVQYALAGLIAGAQAGVGSLLLLFRDTVWKGWMERPAWRRALAVTRGLVIAIPLLLIFTGLFAAADAVFEGVVRNILHLDFLAIFTHSFAIASVAWVVAGFLRGLLVEDSKQFAERLRIEGPTLGITEIGTILGLLDLLFLGFVIVQIRYLFGGGALVGLTPGLTYADYARRGFFELVFASALALPLLLLGGWLARREGPRRTRVYRALAGLQVLLLFVIMASALQRMRLYQQEYGLTELRVYTTAFIGWLAVVFVWFVGTALRGRRDQFAFGALVAGFALVGILHLLNPDALIARTNMARGLAGR